VIRINQNNLLREAAAQRSSQFTLTGDVWSCSKDRHFSFIQDGVWKILMLGVSTEEKGTTVVSLGTYLELSDSSGLT
jgi:hypothetical protein